MNIWTIWTLALIIGTLVVIIVLIMLMRAISEGLQGSPVDNRVVADMFKCIVCPSGMCEEQDGKLVCDNCNHETYKCPECKYPLDEVEKEERVELWKVKCMSSTQFFRHGV